MAGRLNSDLSYDQTARGRLPAPDNGNILVADMAGKAIRQIAFSGQDVKIDLTGLAKGYYMVWVKGQQYTRTLSVLKL